MVGPRARKGNRRFFAARDVGMSGCSSLRPDQSSAAKS
jgi:hypothetical protein